MYWVNFRQKVSVTNINSCFAYRMLQISCGSILVLKNLKTANSMAEIGEYEHKIQ